jgi:hypothetical protein
MIRLKFVLKYANTYDSTWDNVDVIKWSLIEILAACICGNLMPLHPLADKILHGIRSLFSGHAGPSLKSSAQTRRDRSWPKRPLHGQSDLISTLHSTNVSLGAKWDRKNGTTSGEMSSFTPPLPVHLRQAFQTRTEERHADRARHEMTRKTSTTGLNTSECERMSSLADSESHLVLRSNHRSRHMSGSWSRALSVIFDRR